MRVLRRAAGSAIGHPRKLVSGPVGRRSLDVHVPERALERPGADREDTARVVAGDVAGVERVRSDRL